MVVSPNAGIARTLGLVLALSLVAPAAMAQTHPHRGAHHRTWHRYAAAPRGDIVVHARRSYLDPGPPAWYEQGRGDRYSDDTTPVDVLYDRSIGPTFGFPSFETLQTRFNPPGRSDPLFTFSEP